MKPNIRRGPCCTFCKVGITISRYQTRQNYKITDFFGIINGRHFCLVEIIKEVPLLLHFVYNLHTRHTKENNITFALLFLIQTVIHADNAILKMSFNNE